MTLRGLVPLDFRTSYENESYGAKTRKNFTWITEKSATPALPAVGQPVTTYHYDLYTINHFSSTLTKFRASYARSSIRTCAYKFVTAQDIVQVCLRTKLQTYDGVLQMLHMFCMVDFEHIQQTNIPVLVRCIAEVVLIQIIDPRLVRFQWYLQLGCFSRMVPPLVQSRLV